MILELANQNDLENLEHCGKKCLPIYYKKKDLENLHLDELFYIFKIHDNKHIIGFIILKKEKNENNIHINSIGILPEYRSLNIGSHAIQKIKELFPFHLITLYVQTSNNKAIRFYKKNGFIILTKKDDYYKNLKNNSAYKMIFYSNH